MDEREESDAPAKPEPPAQKRPYARPHLTEHGTVESLTAGSRSRQEDGASGGFRRSQ